MIAYYYYSSLIDHNNYLLLLIPELFIIKLTIILIVKLQNCSNCSSPIKTVLYFCEVTLGILGILYTILLVGYLDEGITPDVDRCPLVGYHYSLCTTAKNNVSSATGHAIFYLSDRRHLVACIILYAKHTSEQSSHGKAGSLSRSAFLRKVILQA